MTDDMTPAEPENQAPMHPEVPAETQVETDTPPTDGETEPPKKRKTWIWILVAVLVLAAAGIIYASQSSDSGGLLLLFGGNATVPQVVGLTQQDAEAAIVDAGLTVGQASESPTLAVAPGVVFAQAPAASAKVEKGSAVDISVAAIPTVGVPDVTAKTLSDASAVLAEEGLLVGTTTYVYDSNVKAGQVKSQDPEAGAQARIGSAVALTVSKGQEAGQVPNVVGLSESDATAGAPRRRLQSAEGDGGQRRHAQR